MEQSAGESSGKKLIRIDITSDTVCPWCYVGKLNLDKAISLVKDKFDFEIFWHPFVLDPSAPKEGINKRDFYKQKFEAGAKEMEDQMSEVFRNLGLQYDMSGLTGSSLDSHRLIYYAGQQGSEKQHKLVEELFLGYFIQARYIGDRLAEELFLGYFIQARYIGDRAFLLEAAEKVGLDGAAEFLEDPNNGLQEVNEEIAKSLHLLGVPHFLINGKHKLSGGQPPEIFLRAFGIAAKDP